ncbi:unnamed protein product [Ectocarpus sp. 8 AP-2014]
MSTHLWYCVRGEFLNKLVRAFRLSYVVVFFEHSLVAPHPFFCT